MNRWKPWFRKRHVIFLFSVIAAIITFVGGSAAFDAIVLRHPPLEDVESAIRSSQLPSEYQNFRMLQVQKSTHDGEPGHGVAVVALAPTAPLLSRVGFDAIAVERGDKPTEFVDAFARWAKMGEVGRKLKPPEKPTTPIAFTVSKREWDVFTSEVEYEFKKVPFGWSLLSRFLVWAGESRWEVSGVRLPPIPQEFATLTPRRNLDGQAIVVGEPQSEAYLKDYVGRRREFVEAVSRLEADKFERALVVAARNEIARSLVSGDRYTVAATAVTPTDGVADGNAKSRPYRVDVRITPGAGLLRLAVEEANRWRESPRAAEFQEAQAVAFALELDVGVPPFVTPVFYEPVSEPYFGKAEIGVTGTTDNPTISVIKWIEEPGLPKTPLVASKAVEPQAVVVNPTDSAYSFAKYASDVDTYNSRVSEGKAELERRWGPDPEAWRIVRRAIAAFGGKDAVKSARSVLERVHGTRSETDGRQYSFKGTTRLSFPFQYRRDCTFTPLPPRSIITISLGPPPAPYTQTSTLNDRGYWQLTDGVMSPDGPASSDDVAKERARSYAENILLHLAADDAGPHMLSVKSGGDRPTMLVSSPGWPDLTLTFGPGRGYLLSVSFTEADAKKPRAFECRFLDFNSWHGMTRPGTIETYLDGRLYEKRVIEKVEPAEFSPGDFRNPNNPGRVSGSSTSP